MEGDRITCIEACLLAEKYAGLLHHASNLMDYIEVHEVDDVFDKEEGESWQSTEFSLLLEQIWDFLDKERRHDL
jgi:hypothetical protein